VAWREGVSVTTAIHLVLPRICRRYIENRCVLYYSESEWDPRSPDFPLEPRAPRETIPHQFEYGDPYAEHIADFNPTFVKVLVRYNLENDEAMNRPEAARLSEPADYVHQNGQHFMFELLVPMTHEQSDRLESDQHLYRHDLWSSLMIAAIKEL
jgi:hypothetical protein